ncbi:hypothetical protein G9A89_021678 [Geosiphon pyriformis]|nr:hypothetical protein G9A89_021678 [Geosiphon pyriformis]
MALILSNKGVCFGCFDTRQRGIEYHTMKDCPLRRRLRRLLFADRETRKMAFEPYLRLLYTDEMTFLHVVSTFSDRAMLGRKEKRVIRCEQVAYTSEKAPLLPPDGIHLSKDVSVERKPRSTTFCSTGQARAEYKRLMKEPSSFRRRRKFVFGAVHERLFPGFFKVDPLIRDFDLVVKLENGTMTTIEVRRITPDEGLKKDSLLNAGILLGRSLSGPGNARGTKVGDLGSMHAIGYRCASTKEVYASETWFGTF